MSTTIEVEIDDMHERMFEEMVDEDSDINLEDWAEDTLTTLIYRNYRNNE